MHYLYQVLIGISLFLISFYSYSIDKYSLLDDKKNGFLQNINGNIRTYYFSRHYNKLSNQNAFSLGGKLNVLSKAVLQYYRIGATLYSAQSLGLNADNPSEVDKTLPGSPVTVLGQAFLQYQTNALLLRGGNQLVTTPWLNEADSRMIPASYQGLLLQFTPREKINLFALRMYRFKSRISSQFTETNLYTPSEGGNISSFNTKDFIGALAMGGKYQQDSFNFQAWQYQFYDIAKLFYTDLRYIFTPYYSIKPFIGLQFSREVNDENSAFLKAGLGKTNVSAYGAHVGGDIENASIILGYNNIPKKKGTFKNGDIISPYTHTYTSDPLYTTSMIAGLIEKTAGTAFKLTGQYRLLDKQLTLAASYAHYFTQPYRADTTENDVDIWYMPAGYVKELSLRYRLGILNGDQHTGKFLYHRLMIQYDFC